MTLEAVNPEALGTPRGYSHGVLGPAAGGRLLFVAGQPGFSRDASAGSRAAAPPFAEQFARALDRVIAVVREAGGVSGDIARMTVYVTDLGAYRASLQDLRALWRARFGSYYPAMALLEVKGLVDEGALVEIEATALLAERRP